MVETGKALSAANAHTISDERSLTFARKKYFLFTLKKNFELFFIRNAESSMAFL
jgi:hypothetical protein